MLKVTKNFAINYNVSRISAVVSVVYEQTKRTHTVHVLQKPQTGHISKENARDSYPQSIKVK